MRKEVVDGYTTPQKMGIAHNNANLLAREFLGCRWRGTIIFHHRDSRKCDRNNTMGKRATLTSEIKATIIGLKKTEHQTKEIVKLTGVCTCSVRNYIYRFNKEGGVNTPMSKPIPGPR